MLSLTSPEPDRRWSALSRGRAVPAGSDGLRSDYAVCDRSLTRRCHSRVSPHDYVCHDFRASTRTSKQKTHYVCRTTLLEGGKPPPTCDFAMLSPVPLG